MQKGHRSNGGARARGSPRDRFRRDEVSPNDINVPLHPEDLLSQRFPRAVMGYDRVEVDYFLEFVAEQQTLLLERIAELEKLTATAEDQNDRLTEIETRLGGLLGDAARLVSDRRAARQPERPGP